MSPPSEFAVMLRRLVELSRPADRVSRHLLLHDVNEVWYWASAHPETVAVWMGAPLMLAMP